MSQHAAVRSTRTLSELGSLNSPRPRLMLQGLELLNTTGLRQYCDSDKMSHELLRSPAWMRYPYRVLLHIYETLGLAQLTSDGAMHCHWRMLPAHFHLECGNALNGWGVFKLQVQHFKIKCGTSGGAVTGVSAELSFSPFASCAFVQCTFTRNYVTQSIPRSHVDCRDCTFAASSNWFSWLYTVQYHIAARIGAAGRDARAGRGALFTTLTPRQVHSSHRTAPSTKLQGAWQGANSKQPLRGRTRRKRSSAGATTEQPETRASACRWPPTRRRERQGRR